MVPVALKSYRKFAMAETWLIWPLMARLPKNWPVWFWR